MENEEEGEVEEEEFHVWMMYLSHPVLIKEVRGLHAGRHRHRLGETLLHVRRVVMKMMMMRVMLMKMTCQVLCARS